MMNTTETEDHPVGVPLPNIMGQGEAPKEIIYTLYSYKKSNPAHRRVLVPKRSYVVPLTDTMTIETFLQSRVDHGPLPPHSLTRHQRSDDQKPDRQVNIYVGDPCWVVIELDHKIDWRFEPGQPGITVEPGHGDDNCDLGHVMTDGTLAGPVAPPQGVCQLIYFRVQKRREIQHQQFYCHIIHENKRLDDPDQVEPDIPNDGGRFPFPIDGTPCEAEA